MNPASEPPADPAPPRPVVHPWRRPETEFPALVPVGPLRFNRVEPSEVAITAVLAYSNGFEFFVTRLLRPGGPGFHQGRTGPGRSPGDATGVRQPLTIGLAFADGSQVIGNVASPAGSERPPGRVLDFKGGVGSSHRGDDHWWTWPLPPAGPMDFICQYESAEERVSVDAQLILDAARRSLRAWPA